MELLITLLSYGLTPLSIIPEFWVDWMPNWMYPFSVTDFFRVLLVIPVLAYIVYRDYHTRQIPQKVWIPVAIGAGLLLAHDLIWGPVIHYQHFTLETNNISVMTNFEAFGYNVIINFGLAFLIGYLFNKFRLFGGADLRAFLVFAILFPVWPMLGPIPAFPPAQETLANPFFLAILQWTALLGIYYPLRLFVHNVKEGNDGTVLEKFLGRPMSHSEFMEEYGRRLHNKDGEVTKDGFPAFFFHDYIDWLNQGTEETIESINDLKGRRPKVERFLQSEEHGWYIDADDDDYDKEVSEIEDEFERLLETEEPWIMPGAPFLIPLSLGVALAVVVGDPMEILFLLF